MDGLWTILWFAWFQWRICETSSFKNILPFWTKCFHLKVIRSRRELFVKKSGYVASHKKTLIAVIQQYNFNNVWLLKCLRRLFGPFHTFKNFLKVIDCTQQLQVIEKGGGGIWEGAQRSESDERSNSIQLTQPSPWLGPASSFLLTILTWQTCTSKSFWRFPARQSADICFLEPLKNFFSFLEAGHEFWISLIGLNVLVHLCQHTSVCSHLEKIVPDLPGLTAKNNVCK